MHEVKPNILPKGWIEVLLGDILHFEYGKSLTKVNRRIGVFPVYGSNGIVGTHDEYLVAGPVIIIGRKGSLGTVHYCRENCWPIDTTYYITPLNFLDFRFVFYLLKEMNLQTLDKSTTIPGLNREILYKQIVRLPPLNEQKRIVDKVEELLSELDKCDEQLEKALLQLQNVRKAILSSVFQQKFKTDRNSSNAPTVKIKLTRLSELLDFIGSGSTPKGGQSVYQKSGIMLLRSQNIYPNKLQLDNVAYISTEIDELMRRSRIKPCDVLLNITGASIGRCAYVPVTFPKANVNQHVCILRPKKELLNYRYLSNYLNSPEAQIEIMSIQTGATRQGLNYSQIKSLKIPLPSLIEQEDALNELERQTTICDNIEESIRKIWSQTKTAKKSILKKAFNGNLVEQSDNDESAAVIIEKIKSELSQYLLSLKESKVANHSIANTDQMDDKIKSMLEQIQESQQPISAKQLWASSIYKDSIDDFYAELKTLIENGDIVELPRIGKESLLKISNVNENR